MKWLILSDERHLRGGLQSRTRELASAVLNHGGCVQFACLQENPYQQLAERFPDTCQVMSLQSPGIQSLRPSALRWAWRLLRNTKPDVLFFCNTGIPKFLPVLALARAAGVRRSIAHFGSDVLNPDGQFGRRSLGREFFYSARFALRKLSLALFNNDEQLDAWQRAYAISERRCRLWNCPIDLDRFFPHPAARTRVRQQLQIADDVFVIGGVGALNRQKSFEVAVRSLAHLRRRIPDSRLVIAGEGDRESLEKLARELGVADRLHLLGARDDVPDLMNAVDVFCIPSTHPNETLGIAFVEAQASGVPIVVPDLPGPRRVAGDGASGLVVEKGNDSAFAEAWASVHSDAKLRQRLIASGVENAKAFERNAVFRRLLAELGMEPPLSRETLGPGAPA